jgi:hypothetical protein
VELKHLIKTSAALLLVGGLMGCSQGVQFAELSKPLTDSTDQTNQAPGEVNCEPGKIEVVVPTKVVFVVDQSGSNLNGPYGFPGMATDPSKSFRYGVMSEFFQEHGGKQHLGWGFVTFNGTQAQGLINDGNDQTPRFTSQPEEMVEAFADFAGATDVGNTPYRAALTMVRGMIQRDLATALPNTQYLVAFITDGHPTDYCPGGVAETYCPGAVLESQLDADVQSLVGVASTRVKFSTIYYGLPDTEAAQRLARMASMGGGQFVDTNSASEIKMNDVLSVPRPICQ